MPPKTVDLFNNNSNNFPLDLNKNKVMRKSPSQLKSQSQVLLVQTPCLSQLESSNNKYNRKWSHRFKSQVTSSSPNNNKGMNK